MRNESAGDLSSQPLPGSVRFRCVCGNDCDVSLSEGGACSRCGRAASRSLLERNLSVTFRLDPSDPGLNATTDAAIPGGGAPSGPQNSLPPGTRLGHFEIVNQLGSGGMGQVYRALDRSLQRFVAVKVLKSKLSGDLSDSSAEIERLMQEAVAQARVPHPNVVPIYYVGKHDGSPFLAMELVAGTTLTERLARGKPGFPEIAGIALQLTDALRFAKELDLIHGDIKPSNIMVQNDLLAKLSDFGMARRASGSDGTPLGGTPNYLAPELLDGATPSVQSDIYALGVTLYEMTFGQRPVNLSGRTVEEWAQSHRSARLSFPRPWPEWLPESWRGILETMLAPQPEQRFADYDSLREQLIRVAPTSSPPARLLPRVIAAAIDFSIVLAFTAVVFLLGWLMLNSLAGYFQIMDLSLLGLVRSSAPWYTDLAVFGLELVFYGLAFLPVFGHTMLVGSWRQSLGRLLLHTHVVNRFGLRPTRRTMIAREAIRSLPLWVLPLFLVLWTSFGAAVPGGILVGISVLFTAASLVWMAFGRSGQPFHDRILKTRAVLDTQA